jgi:hypothetical protein
MPISATESTDLLISPAYIPAPAGRGGPLQAIRDYAAGAAPVAAPAGYAALASAPALALHRAAMRRLRAEAGRPWAAAPGAPAPAG